MAVVTVASFGYMRANHHLDPPSILAKVLCEACHIAFGQFFKFTQQLPSLVHRHKTLDPKHDLELHHKGQPLAKRLVFRIHQSLVFHDDRARHESDLSAPFRLINPHPGPITYSRQDPWSMDKKVYPWGVPPRMSFRSHSPHVMPLHRSAPWVDSLKHAAHLVLAHSALFSQAVQDGEVPASTCALLRAYYGPDGHVIHLMEPPNGKGLFNSPAPSNPQRRPHQFGQTAPVGPPDCSHARSRGAPSQNGR